MLASRRGDICGGFCLSRSSQYPLPRLRCCGTLYAMTSLARRCTACGQLGHTTRTCPGVVESVPRRMVKSRSMPVLGMLRSSSLDDLVSAAAEEAFEDDGEPEPRELGSCREEGGDADEAPEELRNERRKGA